MTPANISKKAASKKILTSAPRKLGHLTSQGPTYSTLEPRKVVAQRQLAANIPEAANDIPGAEVKTEKN